MSLKQAIHNRDRHRCVNCHATEEIAELLDVHHVVPLGVGGGNPLSNQITLCRRCHDAVHNGATAPTIRFTTTGTMTDTEFGWFRHFTKEMIPALARQVDVRMQPMFAVNGTDGWAIPLGEVRQLDNQLSKTADEYQGLHAAAFW